MAQNVHVEPLRPHVDDPYIAMAPVTGTRYIARVCVGFGFALCVLGIGFGGGSFVVVVLAGDWIRPSHWAKRRWRESQWSEWLIVNHVACRRFSQWLWRPDAIEDNCGVLPTLDCVGTLRFGHVERGGGNVEADFGTSWRFRCDYCDT